MTEFELVQKYHKLEKAIKNEGYTVSPINIGFYIHNARGTIVADVGTLDGLSGFLQGVQYLNDQLANEMKKNDC